MFKLASAVDYAQTIAQEHPERREQAIELANLFAKQARRRADRLFDELWANDDDDNYKAAQQVLDGRFEWIEEGIADPSGDGPMIQPDPAAAGKASQADNSRDADAERSTNGGEPAVAAKVQ